MSIETAPFTGKILQHTMQALKVDFGGKASKVIWLPRKLIAQQKIDKDYPELAIFTLPLWFAKKAGLL